MFNQKKSRIPHAVRMAKGYLATLELNEEIAKVSQEGLEELLEDLHEVIGKMTVVKDLLSDKRGQ